MKLSDVAGEPIIARNLKELYQKLFDQVQGKKGDVQFGGAVFKPVHAVRMSKRQSFNAGSKVYSYIGTDQGITDHVSIHVADDVLYAGVQGVYQDESVAIFDYPKYLKYELGLDTDKPKKEVIKSLLLKYKEIENDDDENNNDHNEYASEQPALEWLFKVIPILKNKMNIDWPELDSIHKSIKSRRGD